jgi:DNA (cytosine-5)-methyltransferase 1
MIKPRAIDAFCGAGGLSIGLNQSGFDVVLGFDIDPICLKTLRNNPKYIKHEVLETDIKALLGGRLLKMIKMAPGELDLLAGGPPCQGFSIQRTIGGDEDNRNSLVESYGDLVLEVQPKMFLMENVPGIAGKRGRIFLEEFKQRMIANNYFVHTKILDASDFGVPQRRRRLILVGERIKDRKPAFQWPETNPKCSTVRDVIGNLPPPPADGSEHPDFPGHRADRLSQLNKRRLLALREGEGRTELPVELLAPCHQVSADIVGHRNVYGRMSWDKIAPTITARFDSFTRGKFGHPEQTRSISLYEGALLQTFPCDYKFTGNKVDVARQIGNAIPPLLATVLGAKIYETLKPSAKSRKQ